MRIAVLFALLAAHAVAYSQAYPQRAVRLVIAAAPGGSTDVLGRVFAQRLAERMGQPFVPENRGGGAGAVAAEFVARSSPDGYTLLMSNDQLVISAAAGAKVSYDAFKDFAPIAVMARGPVVLGVHPAFPAARIDLTHVPYRGCNPAMADAVAGQVPIFFTVLGNAAAFERGGKVRLLAVATQQRIASYPELPTIAESGFPGYDAYPWFGVLAPAGTPREIVSRLAAEITAAVPVPEITERIRAFSLEPTPLGPEGLAQLMKSDYDKWSGVVRDAKIKVD